MAITNKRKVVDEFIGKIFESGPVREKLTWRLVNHGSKYQTERRNKESKP